MSLFTGDIIKVALTLEKNIPQSKLCTFKDIIYSFLFFHAYLIEMTIPYNLNYRLIFQIQTWSRTLHFSFYISFQIQIIGCLFLSDPSLTLQFYIWLIYLLLKIKLHLYHLDGLIPLVLDFVNHVCHFNH